MVRLLVYLLAIIFFFTACERNTKEVLLLEESKDLADVQVKKGEVLVALANNGVHSVSINGDSLIFCYEQYYVKLFCQNLCINGEFHVKTDDELMTQLIAGNDQLSKTIRDLLDYKYFSVDLNYGIEPAVKTLLSRLKNRQLKTENIGNEQKDVPAFGDNKIDQNDLEELRRIIKTKQ